LDGHSQTWYAFFHAWSLWSTHVITVTFINTTNPYLDPCTPDFETVSAGSMGSPAPFESRPLPTWRTSNSFFSHPSTPSSMGPDYAPTSIPMCYTPELEALPPLMQSAPTSAVGTPILTPASLCNRHIQLMDYTTSTTPPPIDPRLGSPYDPSADYMPRSSSIASSRRSPPRSDGGESMIEKDHEIAFLLRWFSEGPGCWMDLFDFGTYFASYVPVKAREDPLLMYAATACAAKALARVQRRPSQTRMEQHPDAPKVDWKHKAAIYYDNAVSLLLQALKSNGSGTPDDSDCEMRQRNGDVRAPKRRRTSSNASFVTSTDDLLAASAILCVYEFLDASVSEWAKHLSGAKSLLVDAQERMKPLQMPTPGSPQSTVHYHFISKARRATFWNIARQDMLAACK
jgi:hypothetical protein